MEKIFPTILMALDFIAAYSIRLPWRHTPRRAWSTRRRNDPDDTWTEKCQATRRANAEKRGYWFTPEGIENMRKSHIGNTKEVVRAKRMEREQAAIMNKLGMR